MESEEFKERRCLLVYDSVALVITKVKIYSIQLAALTEGELTLEEIFTFDVSFNYIPQVCFLRGDLFFMDLSSSKEILKVRCVKDILIYPVEQLICQPEIFLEISEISQREKVVLLGNEHAGEIVLITPDQMFRFDSKNDSWKESDILNQTEEMDLDLDNSNMTDYERQTLDKLFTNPMDIISVNTSGEEFVLFSTQNDLFVRLTLGNPCCFMNIEGLMSPNRVSENIIVDEQHLYYIIKTPPYIDESLEQKELLRQFEEHCKIISEQSQEPIQTNEKSFLNPNNLQFCSNLAVYCMSLPF